MTEFSLPTPEKPVPVATVKVFFYIPDLTDPNEKKISFRFENDSLIHQFERTIRISQMEVLNYINKTKKWLEQILQRKERTSKILFLGTQLEETRINDVILSYILKNRMVELFKETIKEIPKEEKFLLSELLEGSNELQNQQVFTEEEKLNDIRIQREAVYQIFRQVDKDDLGFISHEECIDVFKLMGLNLSKVQIAEILNSLDITQTGIINYVDLIHWGAEIIHTISCKNQAMRDLDLKEEESRFQANLMLIVDQIHDVNGVIVEECKKFDIEDETQLIDYDNFRKVLEMKPDILNTTELEYIIQECMKEYPDKLPFLTIDKIFHKTIYQTLIVGLASQNKTKLEDYLINLLEPHDTLKNGIVHINDVVSALKASGKIMLSKAQLYIVQSFLKQDANNLVLYKKESKALSQMIKKFFNVDLIIQKDQLLENCKIEATTHIQLQTLEQLQFDLSTIGK